MPHKQSCADGRSLNCLGWLVLLAKATAISTRPAPLTFDSSEKIPFVGFTLTSKFTAFGLLPKAVIELFRRRRKGQSFHQYIGYAAVRDFQRGLDAVGVQNLLPSTSETCVRFAKLHGLERLEIQLPNNTVAQWLGPRKGTKIAVLFHGGGYMSPALNEHLSLVFGFARAPRKDISAVILQYDLASENANHYPRQLRQAVSLIDHLVYSKQVSPSEIILIGDSAGAHLLLGLLFHISYPNPLVPPLKVECHFSGAALISPWINLDSRAKSMTANKEIDTLTVHALQYWARNYLGTAISDYWNSPFMVPTEWLKDLQVEEVLILYGDNELLRDDTSKFCEKLETYHPRSATSSFQGEVHSHMILNRFLMVNTLSASESAFVDWMNNHLRP